MAACTAPRLFRHRQTHQYWIAACTRWACAGCFKKVAYQWRRILRWATQHGPAPQYLITLTLRDVLPLWRQAPADQQAALKAEGLAVARRLTRALSRLVAEIRTQHGPFEYLAVVELTTGTRTPGHRPHLHLIARGPKLTRRFVSERWCFHSHGSFQVDIQPLRAPEEAGDYLIGYTTAPKKRAQRQHLGEWPGPRIRYSRAFFPRPVAQIRVLLWPVHDPGMWEYIGSADTAWQLIWQWPAAAGQNPAAAAALGSQPTNYRKESQRRGANPCGEAEPGATCAQAYVSLPGCGCNADCRPQCGPGSASRAPKQMGGVA